MDSIWVGTDLKIKIELTCSGFSIVDDYFTIMARWGTCSRKFAKDDLVTDENDNYYLLLPTAEMNGVVSLVATLYVPDTDFETGKRKEVIKQTLFKVKPL